MKNISRIFLAFLVAFFCVFSATAQETAKTLSGRITQIALNEDNLTLTLQTGTINLPVAPASQNDYLSPDGKSQEVIITTATKVYSGWDSKPKRVAPKGAIECTLGDMSGCLHVGRLVTVFYATDGSAVDSITLLPEHKMKTARATSAPPSYYAMPQGTHHREPMHDSHHWY